MKEEIIKIFDTTLRDGEQAPGCSMSFDEKLRLARQLEKLGVDIIEAGFPASSDGDFEAVRQIAKEIRGCEIAGLSRANPADIDRVWEAVKHAASPRIHTFIATSDIHLKYKLKKTEDEVLEQACSMVRYARRFTDDVEFSAEDATRSDRDFLCRVVETAAVIDNVHFVRTLLISLLFGSGVQRNQKPSEVPRRWSLRQNLDDISEHAIRWAKHFTGTD